MVDRDGMRPHSLRAWCRERLALHEESALRDPLASGVRMLTIDLWDRLVRGEVDRDDLAALAKLIGDEGLAARAARLKGKVRPGDWDEAVGDALAPLAGAQFDDVARQIKKTRAGVVFTAHPTFALSRRLRDLIGALASGGASSDLAVALHAPDASITLLDEHEDTQAAIARAGRHAASLRRVLRLAAMPLPQRMDEGASGAPQHRDMGRIRSRRPDGHTLGPDISPAA